DTFFIDYLGAEDTPYIRAITRKWLVAAVTRIYEPGCKFDYMPVLVGPQGAGKSSTISALAREWFSDSLKNLDNKEAGEHLQNSWIFEFGELAAMKKGEVEEIKAFITKQTDSYRVAYDRVVSEFPRKCVFIGTTNKEDFLRDKTGNRRFWPVTVDPKKRKYNPITQLNEDIIGLIWAEAMELYKQGEKLYLDPVLEEEAAKVQEGHMEEDPRRGLIEKYLDTTLPSHWDAMKIFERRNYLINPNGSIQRNKVCAAEIWCECLNRDFENMKIHDAREIIDIIRKIPGWEERKPSRTVFKHYGKQTTFIKTGRGQ
ncbi:virulence-associated E family protein, partial [Heyndrickxia acidicola]